VLAPSQLLVVAPIQVPVPVESSSKEVSTK